MDTPHFEDIGGVGDLGHTFVAVMTYDGRTAAAIVSYIFPERTWVDVPPVGAWVYAVRGDVSAGPIQVRYARLADAMADGRLSLRTALGVPDEPAVPPGMRRLGRVTGGDAGYVQVHLDRDIGAYPADADVYVACPDVDGGWPGDGPAEWRDVDPVLAGMVDDGYPRYGHGPRIRAETEEARRIVAYMAPTPRFRRLREIWRAWWL